MDGQNLFDRHDVGLITASGQIFIDGIVLEPKSRIKLLSLMNFASPYVELPKNLL